MGRVAHAVSVTLNGATRWRLGVLVAFDGQLRVSFLVVSRLERSWTVAATENNARAPNAIRLCRPGFARWQYERVHQYGPYDSEIDTFQSTPEDCAFRLKSLLLSGKEPEASRRLATEFGTER